MCRQVLCAFFGAMAVCGGVTSTASAGWLAAEADGCEPQQLSHPFKRWLDPMSYTPVGDGGIERRAEGWRLEGDARPVWGNEPWLVRDERDSRSLAIPEGSSATTPAMCVGLEEPTLRFFARGATGLGSVLEVEVLFEDAFGRVRAEQIGMDLGGSWHPTSVMPIGVNVLPLLPGETTAVAFRFTAHGGDFQIDDTFVDPWSQR
jgi:hypothetical protein